jgi:hypothetical protein
MIIAKLIRLIDSGYCHTVVTQRWLKCFLVIVQKYRIDSEFSIFIVV